MKTFTVPMEDENEDIRIINPPRPVRQPDPGPRAKCKLKHLHLGGGAPPPPGGVK